MISPCTLIQTHKHVCSSNPHLLLLEKSGIPVLVPMTSVKSCKIHMNMTSLYIFIIYILHMILYILILIMNIIHIGYYHHIT